MIFAQTPIEGAYLIEQKRIEDHRGYFARAWCQDEMRQQGLKTDIVQSNVGFSTKKGTLRGLHFQTAPHAEVKVVRCTRGTIFDVIVDLRQDSPTYKKWFGTELSAENSKMLYVPEGCAQGYLTLVDGTEICYHTTESFHPELASGIRYNDPEFGIVWPGEIRVLSDPDKSWPDFSGRANQLFFSREAGR